MATGLRGDDKQIAAPPYSNGPYTWDQALTWDSTTKMYFRDSGLYLYSSTDGQLDIVADTKIKLSAPAVQLDGVKEVATVNLPGTVAVNTFPFNNVSQTEAGAAYCVVHDESDTDYQISGSSSGGGYSADYQLFPDTEATDDAVYFGHDSKFGFMHIDAGATQCAYSADSLTWEYYDGSSWSTLTVVYDQSDSTAADGKRSFQQDGDIIWSAPTDWSTTTVKGQSAYWVRARVSTASMSTSAGLTNSVEHKTEAFDAGSRLPYAGTIGRVRFSWETVSGSNNDTKVILVNLTGGTCSAIKTITQAKSDFAISDFATSMSADDEFSFYITQEDGTTEYAEGVAELEITRD